MNSKYEVVFVTVFLFIFFPIVFYEAYKYNDYYQDRLRSHLNAIGQEIYDLGKVAAQKDIDILANPYDKAKFPQEHGAWYKGYIDAKN